MSTQVQYRRGSNVQVAAFTGALGELVIDTTNKIVVVNDGSTVGGFPQVGLTATQTITNKVYQGTSVSVTGSVTAASTVGGVITGSSVSVTGSQTAASTVGGVITGSSASVTGTLTGASTVGGVITGSSASVSGGVTAASVSGGVITGTSLSVSGSVTGTAYNGTSVSVSGGVTAASVSGGVITGTSTSVTGTVTGASVVGGVMTGTSVSVSGAVTAGSLATGGTISATGNITGGNLTVGTGTITGGNIVNSNANGVGNIGSSTTYFNTVFAKATSAQYADLAEMYLADNNYAPGTVVIFGGENEITLSTRSHDTAVAGVISTNPSYLMNSTLSGDWVLPVALTGRVPCLVQGPVNKGDVLVTSSNPGTAQKISQNWQPGCVLGKSLENISDTSIKTIEIAVGRD